MNFLRSAVFALMFYPGTLLWVLGAMGGALIGTRQLRFFVHGWSAYHHWLVVHVLRIRFEWDGQIPPGPYLIAVKHHSMMEAVDTLVFATLPVVVMKRSLIAMPLFGWVTRTYGVIGVDRDAGAAALREMIAAGRKAREDGRPVIIFPEGTRIPLGEAPPLRPGFAGLYRALGLPVVPIAHDVGRLFDTGFVKRSGTVHFKVGEVIPAGLKRDEIETRVHTAINALNRAA